MYLVFVERAEIRGRRVQCKPKGGPYHLCIENQTEDYVRRQLGRHRLSGRGIFHKLLFLLHYP